MSTSDLPDLLERPEKIRPVWLRVLCIAGAAIFFLLGIIGWLVPVITGIPFYAVALILLGIGSERCRECVNRMERRLPHAWRLRLRAASRRSVRAVGETITGPDGKAG